MADETNLPPELRALLTAWQKERQSGNVTLHIAEGVVRKVSAETTITTTKMNKHGVAR